MTEQTPPQPSSRLGKVRAQVADLLLDAVATRQARVLIARSLTLSGPGRPRQSRYPGFSAGVVTKSGSKRTATMLRLVGVANPQARASVEMLYQSTHDYLFSDEKFRRRFPDFQVVNFADLTCRGRASIRFNALRAPLSQR